jgi:hypothetical protein
LAKRTRKKEPKEERSWRVVIFRKTATVVGIVEALDEQSAIKKAIKEYGITDPDQQRRLVAQPWV